MKTYTILIPMILFALNQSAHCQNVNSTAGGFYEGSEAQASVTVGEVFIATISDENNTLTQGFQQSSLTVVGIQENLPKWSITVYPNPTSDYVTIDFGQEVHDLDLMLLDGKGDLVDMRYPNGDTQLQIDMTKHAAGNYFLNVIDRQDKRKSNTYQIIKTH